MLPDVSYFVVPALAIIAAVLIMVGAYGMANWNANRKHRAWQRDFERRTENDVREERRHQ